MEILCCKRTSGRALDDGAKKIVIENANVTYRLDNYLDISPYSSGR